MNFIPLKSQEPNEEYDNTRNREVQTQSTSEELGNILKNEEEEAIEIKDIEPMPVKHI